MLLQAEPFRPPTQTERIAAIGETQYLVPEEKQAFSDSDLFIPIRTPGYGDWLRSHKEQGQTFSQFLRTRRNLLQSPRTTIYLQPIGEFPDKSAAVLPLVREYAEIFFKTNVRISPTLPAKNSHITSRINQNSNQQQFLTGDILRLLKNNIPNDAYAILGVTMTDLYPEDSWNFVFGQASIQDRVGVYSFARHGEPGSPEYLRRSFQVLTHETGHMFGIIHCVHYQCLMNGSNNLKESDATPLYLCPVCLRKLHTAINFDIPGRYRELSLFLKRHRINADSLWYQNRSSEF